MSWLKSLLGLEYREEVELYRAADTSTPGRGRTAGTTDRPGRRRGGSRIVVSSIRGGRERPPVGSDAWPYRARTPPQGGERLGL